MKKLICIVMLIGMIGVTVAVAQMPTTIKGAIRDTVIFTGCLEIPVNELTSQIANSWKFDFDEDMCIYDTVLKHISKDETTIYLTPDEGYTLFCLQQNKWGELSKVWVRYLDTIDLKSSWYYADLLEIYIGIMVKDVKTQETYKFLITDFSRPITYSSSKTLIEVFFKDCRMVIPKKNWKATKIIHNKRVFRIEDPKTLLLYKWFMKLNIN